MSFSPFLITQELVIQSAICGGDAGEISRVAGRSVGYLVKDDNMESP